MTPTQRKSLEKALIELKRSLTTKAPRKVEPNRTSEAEVGGDEDEQPLNEMNQSIASNRNKTEGLILARIDKALQKLRETPDDFGLCEQCEEDIALGRLKTVPYAELCTQCQSARDDHKGRPTRRKLTDYQ